jgi:hypothetical protein
LQRYSKGEGTGLSKDGSAARATKPLMFLVAGQDFEQDARSFLG